MPGGVAQLLNRRASPDGDRHPLHTDFHCRVPNSGGCRSRRTGGEELVAPVDRRDRRVAPAQGGGRDPTPWASAAGRMGARGLQARSEQRGPAAVHAIERLPTKSTHSLVIAGLDPAIHLLRKDSMRNRWTPGSTLAAVAARPGVTNADLRALNHSDRNTR